MVNETEEPQENLVDKAKELAALLKAENDRAEKLRAEQLLSGTAGARVEPAPPKEETAKEYAARIERGEFNKK
jgi:hypothetical protein